MYVLCLAEVCSPQVCALGACIGSDRVWFRFLEAMSGAQEVYSRIILSRENNPDLGKTMTKNARSVFTSL